MHFEYMGEGSFTLVVLNVYDKFSLKDQNNIFHV